MRATDGTIRIAPLVGGSHRLASQVVAASFVFTLAIGLFLLERRIVGALSAPLPVSRLLATALVVAVWAFAVRALATRNLLYIALTVGVVLTFAFAGSYPGNRVVDWFAWGGAVAATVWLPSLPRGPSRGARRDSPKVIQEQPNADSEQVLQQITRIRVDGKEAIRGMLVGEFASGERQVTLYVGFCPPFERLPQVEVNVADDSDATVKMTQVLHNGAQLEVRLPQPASENSGVAIELFATEAETA